MRLMRPAGSPSSSPPSSTASSPRRTCTAGGAWLLAGAGGGAAVQRADHLVGDVHARPGEDDFLEDDVVLLAVEDLLDDAVGALHHAGKLFVAALVQVFLELAPLAL